MRRKSPSALLVEPGVPVSRTRPIAAQMPLRRPMPVAATPSRARNPKIEAVNWSGTVKARTQSATCFPSVGSTQPSWSPDTTNVAAARPKNPSASGPGERAQDDARARRELLRAAASAGRLAHPTTSACGAPVLMRVRNHFACVSASVWQLAGDLFQLAVARRLCRLERHRPGHRDLVRQQVERRAAPRSSTFRRPRDGVLPVGRAAVALPRAARASSRRWSAAAAKVRHWW